MLTHRGIHHGDADTNRAGQGTTTDLIDTDDKAGAGAVQLRFVFEGGVTDGHGQSSDAGTSLVAGTSLNT
jgi:hypothetical protein